MRLAMSLALGIVALVGGCIIETTDTKKALYGDCITSADCGTGTCIDVTFTDTAGRFHSGDFCSIPCSPTGSTGGCPGGFCFSLSGDAATNSFCYQSCTDSFDCSALFNNCIATVDQFGAPLGVNICTP